MKRYNRSNLRLGPECNGCMVEAAYGGWCHYDDTVDERDAAIRERDEAVTKYNGQLVVARVAIKERDAALAAAKSARWNAVFGSMVAKNAIFHADEHGDVMTDADNIALCVDIARRIADQAEEALEAAGAGTPPARE